MIYRCCDLQRRNLAAAHPTLNGIDWLEVIDRDLPLADPLRQRTLLVHCLKPLASTFAASNIAILGGDRVRQVAVEWTAAASPLPAPLAAAEEAAVAAVVAALPDATSTLVVRTAVTGDFSTYTLKLVASALDTGPPADFDPELRSIDFSFKVECPSEFDCAPECVCPPDAALTPDIDYLAKDYASFRRLLLDRMAQLVPDWQPSGAADGGVAIAELLAYVGDQLSYQQDAIATEAYLGTARRRVSLRRHALLVDYPMHDGCNARTWVQIDVDSDTTLTLAGAQLLTRIPGLPAGIGAGSETQRAAMQQSPTVFEPLLVADVVSLHAAHRSMPLYTWSGDRCCLPRGATAATLRGSYPGLEAGDAVLFEEVRGPRTGEPGDADPRHRHVVRLTRVSPTQPDPPAPPVTSTDPLTGEAVTAIEWALADALPFPLCISGITDDAHGAVRLDDISVVRGNLVLVDHGATVSDESLGAVPAPSLFAPTSRHCDRCEPVEPTAISVRFQPRLASSPLTQAAGAFVTTPSGSLGTVPGPFDAAGPAAHALDWSMSQVLPQIALDSTLGSRQARWRSRRSLLASAAGVAEFVVEVDDDAAARVRFGDDEHGLRPEPGTAFTASYRVGNGTAGNVGADTLAHLLTADGNAAEIRRVRNPLPASGGVDPESAAEVRRNAPEAFRTQQRAVTTDDYAAVAERDARVQRAAATLRWTGSWHTVFVTLDPDAGVDPAELRDDLLPFVDRFRMAGHDLHFDEPRYVSLEIGLHICVKDDYFRSDVEEALLQILGNRDLPDGRRGLFHPDRFTFGGTVHLGPLYAAVHAVPGVASIEVTRFQRRGSDDPAFLLNGEMPIGRLEVARLDNDRNHPEHGSLLLELHGGK